VKPRAAALAALAALAVPIVSSAALPRVFIETRVGSTEPYVQAEALVTVQVYSARALYHAELDLQGNADVVVHTVGADSRSSVRREGRAYDVLTRQYVVFGQRSGRLQLPGAVLSAEVVAPVARTNPYYNPGGQSLSPYGYGAMVSVVPFVLHGKPVVLDVRPRPAGTVGSYWLPARQVTLNRSWSQGSAKAHVGDAMALDFTVQAQGLAAEQLPDLTAMLDAPPGLRAYPDDPKLDNYSRGETLVGRREQSVALIADRPGRFTIPALELRWWDTVRNIERTASLPAQSIVVLPGPAAGAVGAIGTDARVPGGPSRPSTGLRADPWLWTSLAFALAWLATLGMWYASGRRGPRSRSPASVAGRPPGASRSRAAFFDGCRANDPRAARRYLLEWVAAEWPAAPPRGLHDLGRRLGEAHIERLLRELDRACYAGGEWQGDALARALYTLPAPPTRAPDRPPIAPLYH
jgi:hypothetical protein